MKFEWDEAENFLQKKFYDLFFLFARNFFSLFSKEKLDSWIHKNVGLNFGGKIRQ